MGTEILGKRKPPSTVTLKGYRLFRVFGFDVKLNVTWLLLALLIIWTLWAGLFPSDYPGLPRNLYWWMGVAAAIGILFSIVFHELSHSLVARRFGLQIRGITLFILGGVAEMEEEPVSPRVEFLMAVAGPLATQPSPRHPHCQPDRLHFRPRPHMQDMARPEAASRYMVVEDGRLPGVISLNDLREYIALKLELDPATD